VWHEAQVYASDLTDEQWALIEPLIRVYTWGRPRSLAMCRVVNAILYILVTDCQWAMLPKAYPNYHSGYYHLRRWSWGSGVGADQDGAAGTSAGASGTQGAAPCGLH